jgi:endonuclease YncB( thermonuclease family)
MVRGSVGASWVLLVLFAFGCRTTATVEALPDAQAQGQTVDSKERPASEPPPPSALDTEGLLIGEFRLAPRPVIDGDTIRVEGIEGSIRLLSIDTEEVFHGKRDRALASQDFEAYLKRKRGDSSRPVKAGTPMGEEAKAFAEAFFDGAETVRLERDDPRKLRGGFGRVLAYAFVKKDGRWTSYSVECVRAGMSPYFTKYGYSHRFHNDLVRAEAEAREQERGIWNPKAEGYGDYAERTAWWNARADVLRAFEQDGRGRDDFIDLSHSDASERLERKLGEQVTVLSTVDRIKRFKTLTRVTLTMNGKERFPLIFFDRKVFEKSGIARFRGEPILARGEVARYQKGDYETLQIVVGSTEQLVLPALPSAN